MLPWPVLKSANGQRQSHAPTTVCGTADGTRRSTVGTLNMGTWAGTGEALAWDIASDVPSTSPSHGSNSGAHGESYSTHTYAFKHSCAIVRTTRATRLHAQSSRLQLSHWTLGYRRRSDARKHRAKFRTMSHTHPSVLFSCERLPMSPHVPHYCSHG